MALATALDLIKRSMRLIGVLDPDEEPQGQEAADVLAAMNQMLSDWEEDGISLGYSPPASTNSTIKLPTWAERAVAYALAVEIAPEFQVSISQSVAAFASQGYSKLLRASMPITPTDMSHLHGSRNTFDINSGD